MAPVEDKPTDDADQAYMLSKDRVRREKKDKGGRQALLAKMKQARASGEKFKAEVKEEEDGVYDIVDEDEYSEIVRQRQDENFIVDDDGNGYIEDGREIFDDDLHEVSASKSRSKGSRSASNKAADVDAQKPGTRNLKAMFAANAVKKAKVDQDVSLKDDEALDDILNALKNENEAAVDSFRRPVKEAAKPVVKLFGRVAEPVPVSAHRATTAAIPRQPAVKHQPETKTVMKQPLRASAAIKTEAPPVIEDSVSIESFDSFPETDVIPETQVSVAEADADCAEFEAMDFEDFTEPTEFSECKTNGSADAKPQVAIKIESDVVDDVAFTPSWMDVKESDETIPDAPVECSQLPLVSNDKGEQVLRFYLLDAYDDYFKQPGVVYLFGKVEVGGTYVSCCVTVKNIQRRVFLLPREKKVDKQSNQETADLITMADVHAEFNHDVAPKYKINTFRARHTKKKYAFQKPDVPPEATYLEVRYPAEFGELSADLKGTTFSAVFGTNTSSLEILLLDLKIKGPSWLEIRMPRAEPTPISWCKLEATVLDMKNIAVCKGKATPSLVTMTLAVKTMPDPKTRQNEVIAVACLVSGKFQIDKATPPKLYQEHFVALTKSSQSIFPYNFKDVAEKQGKQYNLEVLPSERALLGFLLAKIHKYDPDILIGHDIYGFDLDVLIHRITVTKVPHWSKMSRLKRTHPPKTGQGRATHVDRSAICGRILCDLKVSARELIRCKSYDLTELTNHILHAKRHELDAEALAASYSSSQQLLSVVECCMQDAFFVLKMVYELQALQLAWEISNICGNLVTRTLLGGRSERNEYLLLHAFTERDFIVPDKSYGKRPAASHVHASVDEDIDVDEGVTKEPSGAVRGKRKPAYAGGLVLDPKRGFYDKFILLVDFNSLYPSIIREFNICFTTVDHQACTLAEPKGDDYEEALPSLPDNLDEGVLPAQLRILVDCRREAKNALKKPNLPADERTRQDIRQKALKLTANSMYGCLGFTFSRFYAKPLAALVTSKGREILLKTKDMVQSMGLDVIYGDTDSLMINTNCTDIEEIMKIGNKVKSAVNKLYRHLEIEIDGIFKSMLLLKKKKYAALSLTKRPDGTYSETREMKGLDIVRRDWCDLAKEAGNFVVDEILSGKPKDQILDTIHSKLREVGERVRRGEAPNELFHITKQLTKNPQDYPDKKSLPHVQVALRWNSGVEKKLKAGDTVYYVICCDGSNQAATQRAYHPDELGKNEYLTIDTNYYLSQQVHPVVSRLLEPIEGTDAALIAECLGLDAAGYRHKVSAGGENEEMLTLQLSEEEKYRDCQRLVIKCCSCGAEKTYENVFEGEKSSLSCSLVSCSNKQCSVSPISNLSYLMNHLTRALRSHIQRYYQMWLKCSDAACGSRTRALPALTSGGRPICSACNAAVLVPECTDLGLYTQLCYYESLFDLEKGKQLLPKEDRAIADRVSNEYKTEYKKLKAHVSKFVRQCAYADVDLSKLFHGLFG